MYLSEVAEPQKVEVAAGSDLRSVLRMTYGYSSKKLRSFVVDASPEISRLLPASSDFTLDLPPSFKGATNLTVVPKKPITLRKLVLDLMGTAGKTTQKRIERLNRALTGKWNALIRGPVRLPYVTTFVSYELKDVSSIDAAKIVEKLRADPAVQSVEITAGYAVAPSYKVASSANSTPTSPGISGLNWLEMIPKGWATGSRWHLATIAIADTGLDRDDTRFPFWENPDPSSYLDYSTRLCAHCLYGCNFLNPDKQPTDDSVDSHGTHIAGLTAASLSSARQDISKRIELMILKVAENRGDIKPADLLNAIEYASRRNAAIVNLSLTGPNYGGLKNKIKENRSALFVAAAGNSSNGIGMDFDDSRQEGDESTGYPARWSSDLENVISVAAACPNGELCGFSNRGAKWISVAAPGSDIASTAPKSQTKSLSGSSQAAALVTLSAALLYSEGLTTPWTLKKRIIASSDFVPALRGKVFSAGVLNISKAIRYRTDLIRYRKGSLVLLEAGEIKAPLNLSVRGQANDLRLCEVYRIVPNYSSNPSEKIQITISDKNGKLRHVWGDRLPEIVFITEKGERKTIQPIDVLEIVPKQPQC